MWAWLISWLTGEKWKLVYSVKQSFNSYGNTTDTYVLYYLYESNKGNRKLKYKQHQSGTRKPFTYKEAQQFPKYMDQVFPWLEGADIVLNGDTKQYKESPKIEQYDGDERWRALIGKE